MDGEDTSDRTDPPRRRLDAECRRLLDDLRKRCPHLLPAEPLPAGATAPELPASGQRLGTLVSVAAREAAATRQADPASLPEAVVWEDGSDALLVDLSTVTVRVGDGTVLVSTAVTCDQLRGRRERVDVTFVVGTPDRPTGLLAATPQTPIGPRVVVERWADALIAFAWQALLDAVGALAAGVGTDRDGTPLVPTVITARPDELLLQPQARHGMDRVRTGSVVRTPAVRIEP